MSDTTTQSELTEEERKVLSKINSRNGKKGMQSRWSKYTPEQRQAFLDRLQAGRAKYQASKNFNVKKALPVQ